MGSEFWRMIIEDIVLLRLSMATQYISSRWGSATSRGRPNALILATVVSGFAWYFNRQRVNDFRVQQQELIRRVEQDETAEEFKSKFNYHKTEDWQCKKVNLDGVLLGGRFFVKRNRGTQEGYYVLAPFVISTKNTDLVVEDQEKYNTHSSHRKFIINLGWIPRSRKYLVYDTISNDGFGQEVYTDRNEALKKQNQDGLIRDSLASVTTVPITNVTAYVRKGEVQDRANGRVNWKDNYLYKWIDLNTLTRAFRVFNEEEGESVYLERATKSADEPESFPLPASKESVIQSLNTQTKNFENSSSKSTAAISGFAFSVAAWMTFL